jgi:glycosyltransferase involved in cell wall biosynthesis
VITIHDVIPEKFFTDERSLAMMRNKKDLVSRATRIIAISETTKKQLLNFYDVAPDNIAVIPHGSPENFRPLRNDADMPSVRKDEPPYILYVGFRWQYKNFMFFLESVAGLLIRHDIRMTIAGPPPTEEELKAISQLNIRDRVAFVVHPSQAELYQLYDQAFCFAFPSLDEGFGLPLLEAATADCPVICSDIDIFHEICGDSALYFDPRSADNIQMQLEKLISDSSLRDGLIRRGTENLNHFSWQEAASKTLEVYHSASKTA